MFRVHSCKWVIDELLAMPTSTCMSLREANIEAGERDKLGHVYVRVLPDAVCTLLIVGTVILFAVCISNGVR